MIKFIVIFTILFSLFINSTRSIVFAEEASSSALPVQATDSGKSSKLEELKLKIASKAADLKAEIDKKIGNKVYVGKISGVSIDMITVDAEFGSRSVKVDEYTLFQDQSNQKSKKALTLEKLSNGDSIIGLGEVDENNVLLAKKIIKTEAYKPISFSYVFGQITVVEAKKLTLKLKSGVEQIINFGSQTVLKDNKSDVAASELMLTRNVISVMPGSEASESSFIYVLPVGGLKTMNSASPESKIATAAAKKK